MPIDTKVEGSPDGVRSTAAWLRNTLGGQISNATDKIVDARNTADAGWHGDSGDAFVKRMTSGSTKADGLETAAADSARAFDNYAAEIQRTQSDMQRVRDDATAAGLTVDGSVIQEPGPAPPAPGTPPSGDAATPQAVAAYNDAVAASDHHAKLVTAYNTAMTNADAARKIEKLATDTLNNVWADIKGKWFFVAGDLINGAAGALAAAHSSTLLKHSKFLADESAKYLDLAKNAPPGTPAAAIYRDFDTSKVLAQTADDAAKAGASAEARAGRIGLKVGGVLAVGGIVYDIANGKDVDQAIVSGGVGFGASVLAGAAIGTAIPVPIVGTAVGAVGGAVVGIFASGAVDSLYQNGISGIGDAIGDGADAVADTGKAIGGLAKSAWDAVF
ncbi:hypothetical protein FZI91_00125 [Mycobacterium sp. CBMA271]|uniref:hypothetical protein n=1 Tax=unclassified Mycobacteroides TaxID=2618759 RepID=UPI0012DDF589|nr:MULTISPECIES: hypothetical protein [unclassified Mycobacteroides]MUM19942.1 hypothetical protein [Mycobacteroides sp. CBMA 326]MUM20113.1 hypothetical protein [Mycobacteroides sp. CBMA 271]